MATSGVSAADDDSLEAAYDSVTRTLAIKQDFESRLIGGIGCNPGEHLHEFADRIVREWTAKDAEIVDWRAKVERYQDTLEVARNSAADLVRVFGELRWQLRAAESSRRDWAVEAEYRRREAEFEAHGERWAGAIVGREGHQRQKFLPACECGAPCRTLGDWARHLLASRSEEGSPLCACVTDEQANQLAVAGFSRPVCAVHEAVTSG